MIFFFRCRRVRALRCAQWCAWLRRMPARPIRSCISHLRTAPSFRCVRVVVGGDTLGMSISPFVSLCHAVTHKHCLPPSLHPSIFPLYCHSIFKYVYMQDTYSHARTHTHTHTHTTTKQTRWAWAGGANANTHRRFPATLRLAAQASLSVPNTVAPLPGRSAAPARRHLRHHLQLVCRAYLGRIIGVACIGRV